MIKSSHGLSTSVEISLTNESRRWATTIKCAVDEELGLFPVISAQTTADDEDVYGEVVKMGREIKS